MSLSGKYAIVGAGYTPQGRAPGRTALSLYLEAGANAIADAGLAKKAIDGLICYRHFAPPAGEMDAVSYRVAAQLGLSPRYISQEAN